MSDSQPLLLIGVAGPLALACLAALVVGEVNAAEEARGDTAEFEAGQRSGDRDVIGRGEIDPETGEVEVPDEQPEEQQRALNRRARLVYSVPAQYPEELAGSGVSVEVSLSVVVDRLGRASHIRVEESPDAMFTGAALDALSQWEWLPALRGGRVTNERVPLTIPVSEEHGDLTLYDFVGGRIVLEGIRYGGDLEVDEPVRRLFGVRPAYPFQMLVGERSGEVVVQFTVGESGVPEEMEVIEATHSEFGYAAQGALRLWKYSPALKSGRFIPARLQYRISFQPGEIGEGLKVIARGLYAGTLEGLVPANQIDQQPRALRTFNPPQFKEDREVGERHRVKLSLVVTADGEVRLPYIESAPDPLSGYTALAAVGYWRFLPARKDRVPVPVKVTLPMTF